MSDTKKAETSSPTSTAMEMEKPCSPKAKKNTDAPKVVEEPSSLKAVEHPGPSKVVESPSKPVTIKVKPKDGKKKLENKPTQMDLFAKKISSRRRSRSTGPRRGKKASANRSSSLPPAYDFGKSLDKSDPNKILQQWIQREHMPLDDWKMLGTVVKVPREENENQEEENSDEDSTGSKDDQQAEPKLNDKEETVKPKSENVGAGAQKAAVGSPKPEDAVVRKTDPRKSAGDDIIVLHKMAPRSSKKVQSSEDEHE